MTTLCFLTLVLEGYDLLMYGTVVPSLLAYTPWSLDPPTVGVLGSLAAVGMAVGALAVAGMGDRWGRQRTIVVSVVLFSLAMGVCALAPSPEVFGLGRFLVGLGAGALMPTAVAILVEFSASHRRARTAAYGFFGTIVGGMLAGLIAIWLVPAFGFRAMFVAGCLPVVIVLPLLVRYLPESPAFLASRGRRAEAEAVAAAHGVPLLDEGPSAPARSHERFRSLFTDGRGTATILFWLATFSSLVVLFGVSAWLPTLMTAAGFGLSSSLAFVLVLNAGAAVGVLAGSTAADRWGPKPVTVVSFGTAALTLAALGSVPPTWAVYLLVAAAGLGALGTQILLNGFVAVYYPTHLRSTGLGMSLGVGRLGAVLGPTYGGLLVGAELSLSWQFYAFALPAAAGGLAAVLVPMRRFGVRTSP